MILKIFTIRDARSKAYLQPFFSLNEETAVRSVATVLMDPQHTFTQHQEDYSLYLIGEYDDNSGKIEPGVQPEYVCNLVDITKTKEEKIQLEAV